MGLSNAAFRPTILSFAVGILLTACGPEKKESARSADTRESIVSELIGTWREIVAVFRTVNDNPSALAAAAELQKLGDRFPALSVRLSRLALPSDAEREKLGALLAAEQEIFDSSVTTEYELRSPLLGRDALIQFLDAIENLQAKMIACGPRFAEYFQRKSLEDSAAGEKALTP